MPKINQEEYEVLKALDDKWKWIARDENKVLWRYESIPRKYEDTLTWDDLSDDCETVNADLFQFAQWEDEEPYNIAGLISDFEEAIRINKIFERTTKMALEESEEAEVKKDIKWAQKEIDGYLSYEGATTARNALEFAKGVIDQLDEPEVLSQEWIDEHSYNVRFLGTPDIETVAIPRDDLQNLLVPKQEITEEQAWGVIHGKYGDETLQNNIDYVESQGYVVIEKPVIPQFVADWFEEYKEDELIIAAGTVIGNRRFPKDTKVAKWLNEDYVSNSEVFAQAWLAYPSIEVQKQPQYRLKAGDNYLYFNLDGTVRGATKDNATITKKRLEQLPFDVEKAIESGIIEVEEVEE